MPSQVTIYTDGACNPNPGPGGWGAVLLEKERQRPVELSGGNPDTTNNRMELTAAIEGLKALGEARQVRLFTDSKYLKLGITEWLPRWRQRQWRTVAGTPVKNEDLWRALAECMDRHTVIWQWLKGHAKHRWNERADQLARAAIPAARLPLEDHAAIHLFSAVAFQTATRTGSWSVVLRYRDRVKVLGGVVPDTTANRMHLLSAVCGLGAIKKALPVHLYTYSGYLKDGATQWVRQWDGSDWHTREGRVVRHRDLWKQLARQTGRLPIRWHVADKSLPPCDIQAAKVMAGDLLRQTVDN